MDATCRVLKVASVGDASGSTFCGIGSSLGSSGRRLGPLGGGAKESQNEAQNGRFDLKVLQQTALMPEGQECGRNLIGKGSESVTKVVGMFVSLPFWLYLPFRLLRFGILKLLSENQGCQLAVCVVKPV